MKRCLIIFAKEPEKGKVKTRLEGHLTPVQCVDLYKAFIRDTITLAGNVTCSEKILAYDSDKRPVYLEKVAGKLRLHKQKGKNLGERMHNAFKFVNRKGSQKTVIIGSDSPTLPADYVEEAFRQLDKKDVVIGPTYDGGYYLIGLKEPCLDIFKDIKWSSKDVLVDTLMNAKEFKKSVLLLKKWYDVDTPEDLNRLMKEAEIYERFCFKIKFYR